MHPKHDPAHLAVVASLLHCLGVDRARLPPEPDHLANVCDNTIRLRQAKASADFAVFRVQEIGGEQWIIRAKA